MDSNSEDREYHSLEHTFPQDSAQYKVTYTHRRNTQDVSWVTQRYFCTLYAHICVIYNQNVFANTDR